MTPAELHAACQQLGLDTYPKVAEALRMGAWGYQSVGKWMRGENPIPGPVAVAVELMLESVAIPRMVLGKQDGGE